LCQWFISLIPSILESETGKITVCGLPGQRSSQEHISTEKEEKKKKKAWGMCLSSQQWEDLKSEDQNPGWPRQKVRLYIQNIQSKMVGGMCQAVDYLPCMCTLSSNPSNTHTKKNHKKK
jgi:hypothetical protein